jgi:hypothetical protein
MKLSELLAAISKLGRDAGEIEHDLHRHMTAERDPAAHARLHRLHRVIADMALQAAPA